MRKSHHDVSMTILEEIRTIPYGNIFHAVPRGFVNLPYLGMRRKVVHENLDALLHKIHYSPFLVNAHSGNIIATDDQTIFRCPVGRATARVSHAVGDSARHNLFPVLTSKPAM